ncbi:L-threonylcarbamoyladenylate synthase [Propionimicrobium lymphophilum]|uniref:L-threonylcarbamoyladenylate synthase n=1 Tax=Propionimicrobium lymphophilum TaxID=33012 RepID=UPI00288B4861|nr:L-threonylcarbamoyladenylate synthase [Propionimicrobium lymphophilum]
MADYLQVHPVNPQHRALVRTAEALRDGAVIAYPTDSGFALGTRLGNQEGVQRIQQIRDLDEKHNHTLVVSEFAQIGKYVEMGNSVFRAIKAATPGRYTFILKASRDVPRMVQNHKRKTVGVRVPDHVTTLALLDELNEPLVSSSLILPGETEAMSDGELIKERLEHDVDIILDSGDVIPDPTTVVDFTVEDAPHIARLGSGDPSLFE